MEREEELTKARENARLFVEYTRWFNLGPAKKQNPGEQRYLLCLGSYSGIEMTPSLLAKVFDESPSSVFQRLKRLEERGVVTVEVSDKDKRERLVRLTDEGCRQYDAACMFLYGNTRTNPINADDLLRISSL